ncbi:MAG: TRAP transporter substrate-binding protein DctP [Gammaproteobacteria bacterium]|nr:TRAP transporter substrate-binding protein DctP [Gammaproteobacteria bacterium]
MNRMFKGKSVRRALALSGLSVLLFAGSQGLAQAATLKLATVAPEGSQWMKTMRAGADEIKARTDGRVQIKLYGGGVMGADKSMLRKMRIGQLHGGAFVASGLSSVYPAINIYSLPLVFHSQEEIDYVRARMDEKLLAGLESEGLVSFGFAGGGFAKILSNSPVRSLDDLKGQKVWVPEGDRVGYEAMESLGLSPVTLPLTDVMTGLQTGLIDIVATSPVGAVVFQWYTKVKYVTELPVVYVFATMIVDGKAFARLSAEDQVVVREVMSRVYREFNAQSIPDNKGAYEALLANGIESVVPGEASVADLHQRAWDVAADMVKEGLIEQQMLDELKKHLASFRASQVDQKQAAATAERTDK